jgi:hypothetical protein
VATQSLKAAIPAPVRDGVAIVLDALHIRKRFVDGPQGFDPAKGLAVDVAVYFPDNMSKAYQLTQWLPVLEDHPDDLTFGLVVRKIPIYLELKELTKLPIAYVPTFADVMELYRVSPFKAVMYVNNGVGNFQSLTVAELAHIHVNHGESDKICMVSNQVKAYDRVFVAGQAAVLRHRAALSEFNEEVLVRVGRPQLDENPKPSLPESSRRTVLYAPTWAGEDEANNYTSMEFMGSHIIDAILSQDNVRVVYKPHPRIADSEDQRIRKNHGYVLRAIKQANAKDPAAGHEVHESGDILAIFPRVDLLISDVSSIALDFLYLRTEAPIMLTDRRNNISQLQIDSPLSAATPVLTKDNVKDASQIISGILTLDKFVQDRKVLREFYFDNVKAGESAPRFFAAMRDAIKAHSADVVRAKSLAESGTGPRFEHRT